MTKQIKRVRGRPPTYKWDKIFKVSKITFVKGIDFQCLPTSFENLLRKKIALYKRKHLSQITRLGASITLYNQKE